MSGTTHELRANNTSGVPGLRLNTRKGHQVIDVAWYRRDGRRASTSYLVSRKPLEATERALERLERESGVPCDYSPRQAWLRLKRSEAHA